MEILAVDLGKVKSVACDYRSQTGEHEFETVRTEPAILEDLFQRRRPDRVVIEVGPAAGWITDLAARMKIELQVANPSHQGWRWRGVKTKTDRVDAVKLAQLSSVNQLPQVELPSKEVREWRSLIHYRQSLVARRTMIKNTIHAILTRQAISMPSGKRAWTNAGRKWLEGQARVGGDPTEFWTELDPTEWWRGQLAEELRQLREVDCSISSVEKKLDAYAILVEVSWLGLRTNPWMKQVFDRVCRGCPSRRKIAIVAVARRLLIWCWAMMRDDEDWNPRALEAA